MQPQSNRSSPASVTGGLVHMGLDDFCYQYRGQKQNDGTVSFENVTQKIELSQMKHKAKYLKGHYLFGGPIFNHFGHFLAESIHRLMDYKLLDDSIGIEKVIFQTQRPGIKRLISGSGLPPQFYETLSYLGIPKDKILLQTSPLIAEHLWVGKQQSYFRNVAELSPKYLSFLSQRETRLNCAQQTPKKVYVSRVNFLFRGAFSGERYIESIMESNGFTIYHPEKHDLIDQLVTYKNAEQLIFAEGTAIHVLELLAKVDAKIGVIRRRKLALDAIETPLSARSKQWTYTEELTPLPSLLIAKGHKSPATGSAISFLHAPQLASYLLTEFGIQGFNIATYTEQAVIDLRVYRDHYSEKLEDTEHGQIALNNYDEVLNKLLTLAN